MATRRAPGWRRCSGYAASAARNGSILRKPTASRSTETQSHSVSPEHRPACRLVPTGASGAPVSASTYLRACASGESAPKRSQRRCCSFPAPVDPSSMRNDQ